MPLLGGKSFELSAKALEKSSNGSYIIEHTGETFSDKLKYQQVVNLYNSRVWTCQCTRKANLTHEEAQKSEKVGRLMLSRYIAEHLLKPILEMIHHDTRSLDGITEAVKQKLEHEIYLGDKVSFNVTNNGRTIWGIVVAVEPTKVMESVRIPGEASSVDNVQSGSNSKKIAFKYSVKLSNDKKVINSVPAEDLVRFCDRPSKNILKQFIRSSAIKCGANSKGPWIVNDDLVTKYSLTGKLVELLIPLHIVNEDGSEFRKRKIDNTEASIAKKRKLNGCDSEPKNTKVRKLFDAVQVDNIASSSLSQNDVILESEKDGNESKNHTAAMKKSSSFKTDVKIVLEDCRTSANAKSKGQGKSNSCKSTKKSKSKVAKPIKAKRPKKNKKDVKLPKVVSDDTATKDEDTSPNFENKEIEPLTTSPVKSKVQKLQKEVSIEHSPKGNSGNKRNPLHQLAITPPRSTPLKSPMSMVSEEVMHGRSPTVNLGSKKRNLFLQLCSTPTKSVNAHSPKVNSENKRNPTCSSNITPSKTLKIMLDAELNMTPNKKPNSELAVGLLKEKLTTKISEGNKLENFSAKSIQQSKYPVLRLHDCMLSMKSPSVKTGISEMKTSPNQNLNSAKLVARKLFMNENLQADNKIASVKNNASFSKSNSSGNDAIPAVGEAAISIQDDVEVVDLTCSSEDNLDLFEDGGAEDAVALSAVPVKKAMKQMTLLEMNINGPGVICPKGELSEIKPAVIVHDYITIHDKDRAISAIRKNNDLFHRRRLATNLTDEEIAELPPDVKDAVVATKERLEKRKMFAAMNEEEKQAYYRMERKKNKLKPKPQKILMDDKCIVTTVPLPIPAMVSTPDNIPNELFGDVAMVVEFFSIYTDLLMPAKPYPVTADFLMTALGLGKSGFRYISNILMIVIDVLIRDNSMRGFTELGVPLLDLNLDCCIAPELTRICLQGNDTKKPMFQDVPCEVLSLMEDCEMYELKPHVQLQIITSVCNLVMNTLAAQEHMEEKRLYKKECWKKQMDIWLKKKELKANAAKENCASDSIKTDALVAENADCEPTEEVLGEDVLSTIRKRRQALAHKSLLQEQEPVAVAVAHKVENPENSILEEIAEAKAVKRVQCLGMDRNYSRYWVFPTCLQGLYVEKGWASNCEQEQDGEVDMRTDTLNESIPTAGQNLWFIYKSMEEIKALSAALDPRGCREHHLLRQLQSRNSEIMRCLVKRKFRGLEFSASDGAQEMIESFRNKLLKMESKLRKSNFGNLQNLEKWTKKLYMAETCESLGECLVQLQSSIHPAFCMPLGNEAKDPKDITDHWKEIVSSCYTLSRLHVLFGVLYAKVNWEKSAKSVKCNICCKMDMWHLIVTCSDCARAFHTGCLKPKLSSVPEGNWQCPTCMPRESRSKERKVYRHESEDSEESNESEEEDEEDVQCAICDGTDAENIVTCAKCNSSYHINCHVPNLRHRPRGDNWECDCCKHHKNRQARKKIIDNLRKLQKDVERSSKGGRNLRKRTSRK